MMDNNAVLITGASSGIGLETAQHLASNGYNVFGTSRRTETKIRRANFTMIPLDVRSQVSVQSCVETVLAEKCHETTGTWMRPRNR